MGLFRTMDRLFSFLLLLCFFSSLSRADSVVAIPVADIILPRELVARANSSGQTSSSATSNDFTCGPDKPCVNGACCGKDGWCGYSSTYCGDGCQSNCEATAECGQYADPPGTTCPLNVCCSEFGFCGTTEEFCTDGCQSNCDQPKPSVAKTNVRQKIIAYWEGWNENKACENMSPDEIPIYDISHLIFAFGFITPGDFSITNMPDVRAELFDQVTYLKNKNPSLTIMIALGGWTHNDPGKWQPVFGDMVSTAENRQAFISNLLGFLAQYGFDGVDFDWEYPGADDRGGHVEDGVNYTQFLRELRQAIKSSGRDYVVTFTAPTSYWYLRHFDLKAMSEYVDWINLMSYDLHGTWDSDNAIGSQVLAHTNITEIDLALDLFWRNDIPPSNIVLGLGFYGRSFKLENAACYKPGCPFVGGGDKGKCTDTAGFLSYSEIMNILDSTNAKATYDEVAKVNYIVYGQNNWISYDDARTFQDKIDFANERGLSGIMIWAIDLDDPQHTALGALTGNGGLEDSDDVGFTITNGFAYSDASGIGHSTDDASKCRITDCNGFCTQAETAVGRVKSNNGANACGGDSQDARWVCCPAWTSLTADDCHWNAGGGAVKTDCSGKCDVGDINMFSDSWGWTGDIKTGSYDYKCLRGKKVFCCKAGNLQQYLDICSWTGCEEACPSDKQNVLTWDAGGPIGDNPRCDSYSSGDVFTNPTAVGDASDPKVGTLGKRKLCCPQEDSFKNCAWKGNKVCSELCNDGQITLDLDPQGQGGYYCANGRQQVFCCDAPGHADQPFLPVDLDRIFPPEYLPAADAIPQFELINFNGGIGLEDPNATGVAFFLLAGSDTALASMSKRGNPGIHFLDCPENLMDAAGDKTHSARVICMDGDVASCFAVTKNGVEGTIVHMPDTCGNGSYARAVSLEPSQDQSIPVELAMENPTSAVYDFVFDYNMALVRRDAGSYSIRMDYSNVHGYWNAVVDSPGKSKRSLDDLVGRFYADNRDDWFSTYDGLAFDKSASLSDIDKTSFDHLVFFDTQMCTTDEGRSGQGVAITINGTLDVDFYYGFSLIATWDPTGSVAVHQSAGFLHPVGTTSATFTVAGIGTLDSSKKLNGDSITKMNGKSYLGGHSLFHGWASFSPYREDGVQLKTTSDNSKEVSFNGYMELKARADWGSTTAHFPGNPSTNAKNFTASRNINLTPVGNDASRSEISLANIMTLGLDVELAFSKPYQLAVSGALPDMSVTQTLTALYTLEGSETEVCLSTGVIQTHKAGLVDGAYVGWTSSYNRQYVTQARDVLKRECFSGIEARSIKSETDLSTDVQGLTAKKNKRQNQSVPGDFSHFEDLPNLTDLINRDASKSETPEINCDGCGSCVVSVNSDDNFCCNCAWLPPDDAYLAYMTTSYKRSVFDPLMSDAHMLEESINRRDADNWGIGDGEKKIAFWDSTYFLLGTGKQPIIIISDSYPAYPSYYTRPNTNQDWDSSPKASGVKKYFHNSSAVCSSFDVAQSTTYGTVYPWPKRGYQGFAYRRGQSYHMDYQTEHVFEGQTISRFFTTWLPNLTDQTRRRQKLWTESYILSPNSFWGQDSNGNYHAFVHRLVDQLGSKNHPERLTVFMSRPNGMKGSLFKGNAALTEATFRGYDSGADQLLAARQLGMVFTYMNLDTVWESFCDSYNGMLSDLEQFDDWYQDRTGANSYLAAEWSTFIRSELDMVVKRARADLRMMNQAKDAAGVRFANLWSAVMNTEILKIKLERTDKCTNLPPTTLGPR